MADALPSQPKGDVDSRAFRDALGRFATGVAVVTCREKNGALTGVTVNSFASVSLDPPLILFCLERTAPALKSFQTVRRFGVNILGEEQQALSERFAGASADPWAGLQILAWDSGSPILADSLAALDCSLLHEVDGGDHLVLVGLVRRLASRREGSPLLFFRGKYRKLSGDL